MIGRICFVHGEHSRPVPIEGHHLHPSARGGDPLAIEMPLCANAHGLVHALLDEFEAAARSHPYATVQEVVRAIPDSVWAGYPGRARLVAYRGWQAYGLTFLGHRLDRQYDLWDSAGHPRDDANPAYGQAARLHALPWRARRRIASL